VTLPFRKTASILSGDGSLNALSPGAVEPEAGGARRSSCPDCDSGRPPLY